MWAFFQRSKSDDPADRRRPTEFHQLLESIGDYSDLEDHDASIKFWLPQPAADALKEIKQLRGESINETLLIFLLGHCYGFYFQQQLLQKHPKIYKDPDTSMDICFSNRRMPDDQREPKRQTVYFVPELGKNIYPIKLWIPARLKDDLARLAEHAGLSLSGYLREITIARIFGHGMLPMRPSMLEALSSEAAEDWCDDKEVPWREATLEEYQDASVRKTDTREFE